MAIATKIKPQNKSSFLPEDFQNQIANNLTVDNTPEQEFEVPATPVVQPVSAEVQKTETKSKYNDVANLHFSRGKKAEFKAFFSANEVTLVQGVENAVNYIMKEVKAGRLKVSRNGIEKVGE